MMSASVTGRGTSIPRWVRRVLPGGGFRAAKENMQGGHVRENVVLADVEVLRPGRVRRGGAGMPVPAAVGGPVVRPAGLQPPPADPAAQQPGQQVPPSGGRAGVPFGAEALHRDEVLLADQRW